MNLKLVSFGYSRII